MEDRCQCEKQFLREIFKQKNLIIIWKLLDSLNFFGWKSFHLINIAPIFFNIIITYRHHYDKII